MGSVPRNELRNQEAAVFAACLEQVSRRPLAAVTLHSIAEGAGLSFWTAQRAIRRTVGCREQLIRRVILQLAATIEGAIAAAPAPAATVCATIEGLVEHMAEVVRGAAYTAFLRLIVIDGDAEAWIRDVYERRIASAFCHRLESDVGEAGLRSGVAVCLRPGAAEDVLRRLERWIALPSLLPGDPAAADERAMISTIVRRAFDQSYAWDLGAAA